MGAQNPADPGLRELWESYPLEEREARERGAAGSPDERARPSSSARISYPQQADDSGSAWLLIAAPAALALVLAGTLALLHVRGRRSSPSGVALPRRMPEHS